MDVGSNDLLRFVIVPKVAHPWYDEVLRGARSQAEAMTQVLRRAIEVDFRPPAQASVAAQHDTLSEVLESEPAGIAIDPVESARDIGAISEAIHRGIAVVVFDSPAADSNITGVGNDFGEQGEIAARRLAELLDGVGEVAVMQGVPDAPNHLQRYRAQLAVLANHPDLGGYLACDASGPIGIDEVTAANAHEFLQP